MAVTLPAMCNVLHVSSATAGFPQQQQSQTGEASTPAAQSSSPDDKLNLSDQVIQDVLEPLRTGVETQNVKQILSVFDKHEFSGYGDLEQQLRAFYRQYQQVNFRYQILQAAIERDHASATAEIDMDAMPYTVTEIPARRSVQMRFQLKQEDKGWKIVGFSPSNFFSLDRPSTP
ncbi:MAG TPA: hypothetical protein VGG15_00360 [Terriglobales bacterium]|jgi:hypothetical protein